MTDCEHCYHEFHGNVPGFSFRGFPVRVDGGMCCKCKCISPQKNLENVVMTKEHPEILGGYLQRLREAGK